MLVTIAFLITASAMCRTKGFAIVTDFQGVKQIGSSGAAEYILTDPGIHSCTTGLFGPDDLGEEGLKHKMAGHKCNEICRCDECSVKCCLMASRMRFVELLVAHRTLYRCTTYRTLLLLLLEYSIVFKSWMTILAVTMTAHAQHNTAAQ